MQARANVPRGTALTRPAAEDRSLLELLERGFAELPSTPTPDQLDALAALAEFLSRWAEGLNLTGHRTPAAIVRGLILGAAALLEQLPPFDSAADLGSGAGFPGFPFAILAPERRFVLVEARQRRVHFQRAVRREFDLANVEILRGRAEGLDPVPCDLAIGQAVAPPSEVLGWLLRWAKPGGWVAIPGSQDAPDPGSHSLVGPAAISSYRDPLGGQARTLWCARNQQTPG